MKICIIVHSHTGNTLFVAQGLKEVLLTQGHSVIIERVTAYNEEPSARGNIQLKTIPDTSKYDVIIFGAPVRAFSLSPVMKLYLSQIASLRGKKVGCFVTQFFPFAWMGGNHSIIQMRKVCESKGANLFQTGIVNWSRKDRKKKINEVIDKLSKL